MGRYELFQEILRLCEKCGAEITDAQMKSFLGDIDVYGNLDGGKKLQITARITEEEDA